MLFLNENYNSYRIYRTKIQNITETDTNLYLLTTITDTTFIDIRHNPTIQSPNSIIPDNTNTITYTQGDTSKYNNLLGSYNYMMTFIDSNGIESSSTYMYTNYVYSDTNYIDYTNLFMIPNVILNIGIIPTNMV